MLSRILEIPEDMYKDEQKRFNNYFYNLNMEWFLDISYR